MTNKTKHRGVFWPIEAFVPGNSIHEGCEFSMDTIFGDNVTFENFAVFAHEVKFGHNTSFKDFVPLFREGTTWKGRMTVCGFEVTDFMVLTLPKVDSIIAFKCSNGEVLWQLHYKKHTLDVRELIRVHGLEKYDMILLSMDSTMKLDK